MAEQPLSPKSGSAHLNFGNGGHRHAGRRFCWLRLRPHRWSSRWLNGERVGYDGISVLHGCIDCGRKPT